MAKRGQAKKIDLAEENSFTIEPINVLNDGESGVENLAKWVESEDPEKVEIDRGTYELFGQNIGRLVDEKQRAYGRAFQKIAEISRILYPNGVPVEKMDDFALVVRVLDKICRIADGEKSAFGESPWRDIAGYGLLGFAEVQHENKGL